MKYLSKIAILWVFYGNIGSDSFDFFGNTVPSWREPGHIATINITINAKNPLKLGQTVNVSCVATNLIDTATVELRRVTGRSYRRIYGQMHPLSYTWKVSAADHGTQLYCDSAYTSNVVGNDSIFFHAMSENIPLVVQGVTTKAIEPDPSQQVYIRVNPNATTYKKYTNVQYVCETKKLRFPVVDIVQRKGNLEYQLYTGYQTGYRWMHQNVTESDKGTQIYCRATVWISGVGTYSLLSTPHHILDVN